MTGLRKNAPQSEVISLLNRLNATELDHLKNRYHHLLEKAHTQAEIKLSGQHGLTVFVSCSAYLATDLSAVVVMLRDITSSHQHQEYLLKYTMKKNTLLDTLVHHISGALNLMQHLSAEAGKYVNLSADDNLRTYLNLVQANSRHCLEIINDLIATENREAPTIAAKRERCNIVKQLSHIVEELQQSYRDRSIALHHTSSNIIIFTDEVKLLLIINNLISNALKYSRVQDFILIGVTENDREVIISVTDTGIGIPESLKPFIFHRQPDTSRTGLQGEKSSGIGLSIARHLVELIGGRIWFESQENSGSTFSIALPRH